MEEEDYFLDAFQELPKPQAAYSLRRLSRTALNPTYQREKSGYISVMYNQVGDFNHAVWSFETETKSMLWDLRDEMQRDFEKLAIELNVSTLVRISREPVDLIEGNFL